MTSTAVMATPISKFIIDQKMSLYIPFVEIQHASLEYFIKIFKSLNLADVKSVDFIQKEYKVSAFVHMYCWYENICVHNLQEKILFSNIQTKIVHDDPEFWVLRKNLNPITKENSNITSDVAKFKFIMYDNVKKLIDSSKELINIVNNLQKIIYNQQKIINNQNLFLHDKDKQLKTMQWYINLHEANIKYLCEKVTMLEQCHHSPKKQRINTTN